MSDHNQRSRFVAMRRKAGMAQEGRETMAQVLDRQDDWKGSCRDCGQELQGTPQQLRSHKCQEREIGED